jgi:hypothetical protein
MFSPEESMPKLLSELRERLLRAGVAPRHVRRYLAELTDHLSDLVAEEKRAGRSPSDAEAAALTRLGSIDGLAKAMLDQPALRSWSARAPWAALGLAPVVALAAAWSVAFFILWTGWQMFLPGAPTPFVRIDGFGVAYFALGRWIYFLAPFLAGWTITFVAARQRIKTLWPALGFTLVALFGGAGQVQVSPPSSPTSAGHVSLNFAIGPSAHNTLYGLTYSLIIFSFIAAPYVIWRIRRAVSASS